MDVIAIALLAAAVLLPGVRALLDSLAYRNRARGKAEIIRAKRAAVGAVRGKRGKSRG